MPPIPAPRDSGYTSTTDVPLYWCTYGPIGARRLVVLHGGPGAHHDYLLPQMLDLAEDHELVFYDQRGGGRSRSDARDPVTWRTHVADLTAIVRELDIGPLEILGYSWGGLLAMLHALDAAGVPPNGAALDADRVAPDGTPLRAGADVARASGAPPPPAPETLLLVDPAPISRAYRERFEAEFARRQRGAAVQRLRDELAASGLRDRDPEAYRQRAFELSVAGYFADPAAARDLTPFRVVARVQQSVWESLGDFDLAPLLPAVRARALVTHGRQDPIPLESSETAAEALGARLVVLDGCGHVPYVEQPQSLFGALRQFLADGRPRPERQPS